MDAVLRGIVGYCFLLFIVRIVGRRAGKQVTPFEFVLVFFVCGIFLTSVVGDDRSITNALCIIMSIGLTHFFIAWLKQISPTLSNQPINEVVVGADLEFQRGWWRFERAVWILLAVIVIFDVLGVFGRGPVAKASKRTNDGSLTVQYERIERFSTPSMVTVQFGPNAVHDEKIQLWVNERAVNALGNQRIIPQPVSSVLNDDGILYTFLATNNVAAVRFALQPTAAGVFPLELRVPGSQMLTMKILVMP